ncbi:alpha-L-arabinofuranosidase precursor [Paraphaeosphaeria sporulosa]|uniref:Alpha-L-arabinofuranosidase n=1 Tax=Paraphaeosphaeria sporulosa TaxID=1460663 RepID=A0A177CXZ1_9PLEO|nr:alpha-L-arabinofuranosidase precursor [Paraphaeosphaeria sporulosa]OAG12086.1 alpha-L-arabinofuranosidase precursor [Paraphaeosphaeria sporulosa]
MKSILVIAAAAVAVAQNIVTSGTHNALTKRNTTLPSSFKWTSTQALIYPKNDSRAIAGIKDPSIILVNGTYHVFASTAKVEDPSYSLVYFNFTSFDKAGSAPFTYLDQSGISTGYRAAPEVFYFEPQKLWYLIFQNGNAAYSTNPDINNPLGWSAPTDFYNGTPAIIENYLPGGYWVDMWVICDDAHCHLFSSDDNGRLFRSQTPLVDFPKGMSEPVIALEEASKYDLFEASNVYSTGNSSYLLLVECIGVAGRYFRSWTSSDIAGPWSALAATEDHPFMGEKNVVFEGAQWTRSISHGEVIRTDIDQHLRIDTHGIRFLYQGVDPKVSTDYNNLPWRLGLLTQVEDA